MADRSEFGWATVKKYDRDVLASDSNDEKRLFKVERNAERTQKRRRRGTSRSNRDINAAGSRYRMNNPTSAQQPADLMNGAGYQSTGNGASRQPVGHTTGGRQRTIEPCFRYAQRGHLQKDCPQMTRVYPFIQVFNRTYSYNMFVCFIVMLFIVLVLMCGIVI